MVLDRLGLSSLRRADAHIGVGLYPHERFRRFRETGPRRHIAPLHAANRTDLPPQGQRKRKILRGPKGRAKLEGSPEVTARWINPKTGESKRIGEFSNSGVQPFSTPEDWEDALLILEP